MPPLTERGNIMKNDIRDILSPLNDYLERIDEKIKEMLFTGIPLLDQCAVHLFIKGGKKIRSSLVVLAGGLTGKVPDRIVEITSSTEIVHAETLVHDDIIDKSILRRGNVTVSEKWGNKIAVLVGDYMYTRALDMVVQDGNPLLFPVIVQGTNDMVKGELYQLQYSDVSVINLDHYMNIIDLKTARFMGACMKLGAVKAGLDAGSCGNLFRFGRSLGLAFQIVDDTLDYLEGGVTGKDAGNDFRDGKVTLPFLHVLEKAGAAKRKELIDWVRNPSDDTWKLVKGEVARDGGIDYALDRARGYVDEARRILLEFHPSGFRDILIELGDFFVNRDF